MMGPSPINIVSTIVLLGLVFLNFTIIFNGPLQELFKNENVFVKTMVNIEELTDPIEWPALAVCKSPFDRNKEKYLNFLNKSKKLSFANETEYQRLLDEAFFTKEDDFIVAIGFGLDLDSALDNSTKTLPKPPYVTTTFLDVQYFGYCSNIHFEQFRAKMIAEGKMDKDTIDSRFFTVIGLKVSF